MAEISQIAEPAAGPAADRTAPDFGVALARRLLSPQVRLNDYRDRLAGLTQQVDRIAADKATAAELGIHYMVLDALAQRFALAAAEALESRSPVAANNASALASASIRAQRAAMAVLSALRAIRDTAPPVPDNELADD